MVLGGGSFGTAMAAHVADRKAQLEVNMLVRDPQVCQSINENHCNWYILLLCYGLTLWYCHMVYACVLMDLKCVSECSGMLFF